MISMAEQSLEALVVLSSDSIITMRLQKVAGRHQCKPYLWGQRNKIPATSNTPSERNSISHPHIHMVTVVYYYNT